MVASKSLLRRITAALGALDIADGPMSQLDAARRLREAAEDLEAAQIEAARKAGATWKEIGACYGLTKQGAQQRFRAARRQAPPAAAPPVSPCVPSTQERRDDQAAGTAARGEGQGSALRPRRQLRRHVLRRLERGDPARGSHECFAGFSRRR
jgi:hypothetical protein